MAMSGSGGGAGGGTLSEINVTPLVDVMLVLLIVFMVTAPMLQTGVEVDLPQANAQTIPDEAGLLIVTVNKDKQVFVGKMPVPAEQVQAALKANAKLQADHEAYLHADQSLSYGEIIKIMNAMKQGGADKLGLITDPLK
jgi:biopolymer transport protein TolR